MRAQQLACPHCNGRVSAVFNTRSPDEGVIRRRRVCLACNRRYSTVEVVARKPRHIVDAIRALRKLEPLFRGGHHD